MFGRCVIYVGERGCGDACSGGEKDGTERKGEKGGETQGTGKDGPRQESRDQKPWRQRYKLLNCHSVYVSAFIAY